MTGERTELPASWPHTRDKLERAAKWRREFNEMAARSHWNHNLMGLAAKKALKNALEALLSVGQDASAVGRLPADRIWRYYTARYQGAKETQDTELNEAMLRLLEHTGYEDPYGARISWLEQYDGDYSFRHLEDSAVRAKLGKLLNEALDLLMARIHAISGTSPEDLFQGQAPWVAGRQGDNWYEGPGWIKIRLEPSDVKRMRNFPEALIVKEIGGETYEALVPAHTIGDNDGWIPARRIRTINGRVEFHLPTGNDGRPVWRIPEAEAERISIP